MKDRADLDESIDILAAWVPMMLADTPEIDQMDAFQEVAKLIENDAGPDDASHVRERLQALLVAHCLVPADAGPCA